MSCKDYLFVDKIKKRILLHQELPNSKRVASDEAKIIILLFFYKGVDPTSHFVFMSNSRTLFSLHKTQRFQPRQIPSAFNACHLFKHQVIFVRFQIRQRF